MKSMTKQEREKKWEEEFIPCVNHPARRCNRSRYVSGTRRCASCNKRRADGTRKPGQLRYDRSEQKKWVRLAQYTLDKIRENKS